MVFSYQGRSQRHRGTRRWPPRRYMGRRPRAARGMRSRSAWGRNPRKPRIPSCKERCPTGLTLGSGKRRIEVHGFDEAPSAVRTNHRGAVLRPFPVAQRRVVVLCDRDPLLHALARFRARVLSEPCPARCLDLRDFSVCRIGIFALIGLLLAEPSSGEKLSRPTSRRPGRDHLVTGGRHHPGIPGRNHPVIDGRIRRNRQMRDGSSIAATKASAVSWPTPGIVISRVQTLSYRTIARSDVASRIARESFVEQ